MNTRTNLRKLRNLIYKTNFRGDFYDPRWLNHSDPLYRTKFHQIEAQYAESQKYEWNRTTDYMKPQKEMWDLYCTLNMTPEQLYAIAVEVIALRDRAIDDTHRRPISVRKDNGQQKVGSGGSNRNKIRFPRKCRKTAWKRFYKLFPHLCTTSH